MRIPNEYYCDITMLLQDRTFSALQLALSGIAVSSIEEQQHTVLKYPDKWSDDRGPLHTPDVTHDNLNVPFKDDSLAEVCIGFYKDGSSLASDPMSVMIDNPNGTMWNDVCEAMMNKMWDVKWVEDVRDEVICESTSAQGSDVGIEGIRSEGEYGMLGVGTQRRKISFAWTIQ